MTEDYLTIYEAAELAHFSTEHLRRLLRDKEHGLRGLDGKKIGGHWYIRRGDLEAFLSPGESFPDHIG